MTVNIFLCLNVASVTHHADKLAKPSTHHFMVVLSVGIIGKLQSGIVEKALRVVVHGYCNDTLCTFKQQTGVKTFVGIIHHVFHSAVHPGIRPVVQRTGMVLVHSVCLGYSAGYKTRGSGSILQVVYFKCRFHGMFSSKILNS